MITPLLSERLNFHKENGHIIDICHTDSTATREVKIISFDAKGILISHIRGKNDFKNISYVSMDYIGAIVVNHFYNGDYDDNGFKKKDEDFE